jgi:hypothetical protein
MSSLVGLLIFVFFLLRGLPSAPEGTSSAEYSIGAYSSVTILLVGGLGVVALLKILLGGFKSLQPYRQPAHHLWPLIALFTIFLASYLVDELFGDSRISAWGPFLENTVSLLLVQLFFFALSDIRSIKKAFSAIVVASIINATYYLYLYLLDPASLWRVGNIGSISATYNTLAYALASALWIGPICRALTPGRAVSPSAVMTAFFSAAVMFFGILLTGTKGAIIVVFGLLILYLYTRKLLTGATISFASFAKTGIGIGVLALVFFLIDRDLSPVQRALDLAEGQTYSFRLELWIFSWQEITSSLRTFLLGHGFGKFYFWDGLGEFTYPHNFFFDLGYSVGIVGALILVYLIYISFKRLTVVIRFSQGDLRTVALQTFGLGLVSLIAASIAFKFSSNVPLWMFLAFSSRITQIFAQEYHRAQVAYAAVGSRPASSDTGRAVASVNIGAQRSST